jgi:hypothetical protein
MRREEFITSTRMESVIAVLNRLDRCADSQDFIEATEWSEDFSRIMNRASREAFAQFQETPCAV